MLTLSWIRDFSSRLLNRGAQVNHTVKTKVKLTIEKGGLNLLLADSNEAGAKYLHDVLRTYSEEDKVISKLYTDYPQNYKGAGVDCSGIDVEDLDRWLLKRRNKPYSVAFVVIDTATNVGIFETDTFEQLVKDAEILNVAVYVVLPVRNITKRLLEMASRVILSKPRKVSVAQRIMIYQATCKGKKYPEFLRYWVECQRSGKCMLIEHGQWTTENK